MLDRDDIETLIEDMEAISLVLAPVVLQLYDATKEADFKPLDYAYEEIASLDAFVEDIVRNLKDILRGK